MLITFDTHEYVKSLTGQGFTDEQANALAQAQKKVISDSMDNILATKDDIHVVIDHVLELKTRLLILEKTVWIVIAGIIALVLKSFLFF